MEKFFNTAGPVNPEKHYCISLEERLDVEEILRLIDQEKYFVLHAPRQTGKTSSLLALMHLLNNAGKYRALYVNVEAAQAYREDVPSAMNVIVNAIAHSARIYLDDGFPDTFVREIIKSGNTLTALSDLLIRWSSHNSLPIVLFVDEIDALIGNTLISVLRQFRAGYANRPHNFPQSIVLCGVRDVRDYRIHSSKTKEIITGGSAYNIKAKSFRMGDFSLEEMSKLLLMHTSETGQQFAPGVMNMVWELTRGQPWLVNALAYEVCFEKKENRDRSVTIIPEMITEAAENLILRRETHLDQLADKLKEKRVRRVIQPILAGETEPETIPEDDIQYVLDLGLIRKNKQLEIANKIYAEVIPRTLIYSTQYTITQQTSWYTDDSGKLDLPKLLDAFQEFFRQHSENWLERFDYKEAGPQLLLQAFLQRIINCGGRVEREYGLGRLRTDLLVIWPYGEGNRQTAVIELKIRHGSLEETQKQGFKQTAAYMDRCGTEEGYLIIFDRTPGKKWQEKIFKDSFKHEGKTIRVWGM